MSVKNQILTHRHKSDSPSTTTTTADHRTLQLLIQPTESEKRLLAKILDNEFTCSICLELLKKPSKLECDHMFCSNCLEDWLRCNRTCPMCRSSKIGFKPVKCEFVGQLIKHLSSSAAPTMVVRRQASKFFRINA
ncbi:Zinc finger, RING-type,Zinc finger, RING/FYVE/PHD-type,Zinc finger, RING-type, conserved site [Cinara cedri]|uniref:Zinc finger, RING-type,Zinc finger, RING/FYVE/PHD-type,Zinc finger, RING-type, conserved site n=1 Tax=Cinara cedri TaxID=506608 RepID=A0A5E4M000_9HEMI|nr:Zinc finger, RING-type,Zinc finger, RING/FYVE/PHD-type,Zinc finger, RING-type, conserved site [Cinara cedri]